MNGPRVAYILAKYPSLSENFIRREIEAVRRLGVAVDVYALRKGDGEAAEAVYRDDIPTGEKIAATAWAALRLPRFVAAVARIVAMELGRPGDLARSLRNMPTAAAFARRIRRSGAVAVHAHFAGQPVIVARNVSLLAGIPYTFSVHARDVFLEKADLRYGIRHAGAVAACTQAATDRARELAPPELRSRVCLVRHGLPADEIARFEAAAKSAARGSSTVLMIGRLVEKKGVPVLLRAIAQLRKEGCGIDCVILGDGPERAAIERLVDELHLRDLVKLPGWATPDGVRDWMARAALLAVPSIVAGDGDRDGLPNVILEAAAARLPVVGAAAGGIGEFVTDESTGLLVPPGDAAALAAAIKRLADDERLRSTLAEGAYQKLQREYCAERNAAFLINVMEWRAAPIEHAPAIAQAGQET